jgi:hypothetical protein
VEPGIAVTLAKAAQITTPAEWQAFVEQGCDVERPLDDQAQPGSGVERPTKKSAHVSPRAVGLRMVT